MEIMTPLCSSGSGRNGSGKGATLIRTVVALVAAWHCSAPLSPIPFSGPSPCAGLEVRGVPLEESVDFYQYTDDEGTVHFVDTPEKIPRHYRARVVVRKETPSARQVTKVKIVDRQIHVPVTLQRGDRVVQAALLLDTGASVTIISEELAKRLGFEPQESRPGKTRLADGSWIDLLLARVDAVEVGGRRKAPLEIGIIKHVGSRELHDGLLGLDFLGDFQYQVDMDNQMIRWQ